MNYLSYNSPSSIIDYPENIPPSVKQQMYRIDTEAIS